MAYCKQQSLTYCQFVYWRKKLATVTPGGPASCGFARVAPASGLETPDGLTLSLPGGASIIGLHAGNVELLGAVLRQL